MADLSAAQNNFMSVWLQFYANRIRLIQSMGIMELDANGHWVDIPLEEWTNANRNEDAIPPPIPQEFWNLGDVDNPPTDVELDGIEVLPELTPPQ